MIARRILGAALAATLIGGPLLAEGLYRLLVHSRFEALQERLAAGHPDCTLREVHYSRFGDEKAALEASLWEDLHAWGSLRLRGNGPLHYSIGSGHVLSHAYGFVSIRFEKDGKSMGHAFVWSPRTLGFVHGRNWGTDCPQPGCAWGVRPGTALPVCE